MRFAPYGPAPGAARAVRFPGGAGEADAVICITHKVDEVDVSDDRGAFRAREFGPDAKSLGFPGWVELREGLLQCCIVVAEDFAA